MAHPYNLLKRLYAPAVLLLLGVLCACAEPPTLPNPAPDPVPDNPAPTPDTSPEPKERTREFDICPEALAVPKHNRMVQGYEGWFFFDFDLGENDSLRKQADFLVELSRALATQGVALVVVPVPGRAVIRPNFLYLDDPQQAAFSASKAEANYSAYVELLQRAGVGVVDVVKAAKTFDAGGGQTFFKRDLHWTPEGANAVARETAKVVRRVAKGTLPTTAFQVTRGQDMVQRGQFIDTWLYEACGYVLPPEPRGTYQISSQGGVGTPEVVLAGSSFSLPGLSHSFLQVALQSEVLNMSIGAGGAELALNSYLPGDAYQNHRPQVLVWEWPVYSGALSAVLKRQFLGAAYGSCAGDAVRFERVAAASGTPVALPATEAFVASDHYVSLTFSDLSLLHFDLTLRYRDGAEETLEINRSSRTADHHRGRYFTTLSEGALEEIEIVTPGGEGTVKVQLCRIPR